MAFEWSGERIQHNTGTLRECKCISVLDQQRYVTRSGNAVHKQSAGVYAETLKNAYLRAKSEIF